jgi:hypothetical protein
VCYFSEHRGKCRPILGLATAGLTVVFRKRQSNTTC